MVSVSRKETALTQDTIDKLIETTIDKNQAKQKIVKDIESNETLKEINKTMKTLKEQNDEIIGDVF